MPSSSFSDPLLQLPSHQALVVRSLTVTTAQEREKILEDIEYNIFAFPAGLVVCDYLSDSGTSAMTDLQWSACKMFFINNTSFRIYQILVSYMSSLTLHSSNKRR